MHLTNVQIDREDFETPKQIEGVELGGPIEIVAIFDDRWCCQMCRTVEHICDFHQSMEADGYKPPKTFKI